MSRSENFAASIHTFLGVWDQRRGRPPVRFSGEIRTQVGCSGEELYPQKFLRGNHY